MSPSVAATAAKGERVYPSITQKDWFIAIMFMMSMVMMGLKFPLGYLMVAFILLNRFAADRYQFIVMLTLALGGYGVVSQSTALVGASVYYAVLFGVIGLMVLKKPPVIRRLTVMCVFYAAAMAVFMYLSDETILMQMRTFLNYMGYFYVFVVLMVFSGRDFDLDRFVVTLLPYFLIICVFYFLDAYVTCGFFFAPNTYLNPEAEPSTFYNLVIAPFSMNFVRKYPPGMFLFALLLLPIIRRYKLRWWMWVVIAAGMISTRTFTVISAFIVAWLLFSFSGKKLALGFVVGLVAFSGLYYIDTLLPYHKEDDFDQSTLRIASSIDQLTALSSIQDDEDLGKTGSGRLAQAIPKIEAVSEMDREWIGVGFLNPQETTVGKYVIYNELYIVEQNFLRYEVIANVEIAPVQMWISTGWIGLAIHILFFVGLWWLVRRYRHASYLASVLFITAWFGMGGFGGWCAPQTLYMVSIALAAVLLSNRGRWKGKNENDGRPEQA